MIQLPKKVAVIGLGYVGLPLALAISEHFEVLGFDISKSRINQLKSGNDETNEIPSKKLSLLNNITLTFNPSDLREADWFIVTVPTPIDSANNPDMTSLREVCKMIGNYISSGSVVIFESTVYPGVSRTICAPIIEAMSNLTLNQHFFVGYSPERINPGDKERGIADIVKITSGSNSDALAAVEKFYNKFITAGTHPVSSLEVAEAAKVIENVQRDLNIAFVNQLSILFTKLNLNTSDILDAASTKWNFQRFQPGLVGGHCIGVDPYYLIHKAKQVGEIPDFFIAGRKVNDQMVDHVVNLIVKDLIKRKVDFSDASILILGCTFKENCPDMRNSKVTELVSKLNEYELDVRVYDPVANAEDLKTIFEKQFLLDFESFAYDMVMLPVTHEEYLLKPEEYWAKLKKKKNSTIFELQGKLDKSYNFKSL